MAVVIVGITAVLTYIAWRSITHIEFLPQWTVRKIEGNKIRVNGKILITAVSTSIVLNGTLKLDDAIILLNENHSSQENGFYNVVLDGQYSGTFSGQCLLKLKIKLGHGKSKKYHTKIDVKIT